MVKMVYMVVENLIVSNMDDIAIRQTDEDGEKGDEFFCLTGRCHLDPAHSKCCY